MDKPVDPFIVSLFLHRPISRNISENFFSTSEADDPSGEAGCSTNGIDSQLVRYTLDNKEPEIPKDSRA